MPIAITSAAVVRFTFMFAPPPFFIRWLTAWRRSCQNRCLSCDLERPRDRYSSTIDVRAASRDGEGDGLIQKLGLGLEVLDDGLQVERGSGHGIHVSEERNGGVHHCPSAVREAGTLASHRDLH